MIRTAAEEGVAEIRAMIRELADHERAVEQARTTEEQLREALFGEHPAVFALIAEDDGTGRVVSYALWFPRFSTWTGTRGMHLEDLYVRPSACGGGHGKALLAFLAAICEQRGYERFEWWVLAWNEPVIDFYRCLWSTALKGMLSARTGFAPTRHRVPGARSRGRRKHLVIRSFSGR
ncbi:GNAT family N-acetyltransferase [Streptomyces prasinus]|uniref:GNAT family N-acetyltransferase n=1 Tax=Streptomyces prasinus TaxID=67345 RepID=UPI0033F515F0